MAQCLLIDGDTFERSRVKQQLRDLGHSIVESDGVHQGLRYCNDNQPDLVFMSAAGGSLKAGDFIRNMCRKGKGAGPVVMVYGSTAMPDYISEVILDGAADFVVLPVDFETLQFKLRQAGIA